ncbi:MAG TPA: hypothetical protein VMH88_10810 [Gemmatimonadales bacterium]|nr:hypothetical protein [Gemmatimonadales bacterium]
MNPRFAAAGAALALAACGSQPSSTASTKPTPAPPHATAAPDAAKLLPGSAHYLLHTRIHIQQDFTGLPPVIELGYSIYLSTAVTGPADSSGWPTSFTIDSILTDSGLTMPPGMNLAAARGYRLAGRVKSNGEFVSGVSSDSGVAQSLGQLLPRFRNFYPRLAGRELKPGDAWSDTTNTTDATAGGTITTKSISRRTAAPWGTRNGVRALPVNVMSTFDFSGTGDGGGFPFSIEGAGAGTATQYLGADGRYLGAESRDSSSLSLILPTQGATIPRRQIAQTTLTLLGQ